ncbi:MAG: hypothetical protein CBC35_03865 [Planctomycetes bacterium TMED75]|nr:sialidase [Planctomycetaceae bacterium]OUU94561.1 MAG: hypothetical protein CBC35_03865 [Planctomycetes bacterium TMED75]
MFLKSLLWTALVSLGSAQPYLVKGEPIVPDDPTQPCSEATPLLRLLPGPGNPRNSEGDLLQLEDGSLLLVWTAFSEGTGGDHDPASLVSMRSNDGGVSWSQPRTIVSATGGMNVMSVSLRRLADGRIGLFFLRKHSLVDCRPVVRFSRDDGHSWSDPVEIVPEDDFGYDVLNNDRVLVLEDGALLVPVARHAGGGMTPDFSPAGRLRCYRSEDGGRTWSCGAWAPAVPGVVLQEPGLFVGTDGAIRMFARTDAGVQYLSRSDDGGRTFQPPRPWTLRSPLSPASIQRLEDGRLLAIWNEPPASVDAKDAPRTPLILACSDDEGESWGERQSLFQHESGWYCYVSIDQSGDTLLVSSCAGDRRIGNGLQSLVLFRLPVPPLETEPR